MGKNNEDLSYHKKSANKKGIAAFIISVTILILAIIVVLLKIVGQFTGILDIGKVKLPFNISDIVNKFKSETVEVVIPLVEDETDENNVFKLKTDLSSIIKEEHEEEVHLYQFRDDNYKYGYMNEQGEVIITAKYDYACNYIEGMAVVQSNGKYGYLNSAGEVVIPMEYNYAADFKNGLAIVEDGNEEKVIDKEGNEIISGDIGSFYINNGIIEKAGIFSTKYYDINGKEIKVPFGYELCGAISNDVFILYKDNYIYMDSLNRIIDIKGFDYIGNFNCGLAGVSSEERDEEIYITKEFLQIYLKDSYSSLKVYEGGDSILCVSNYKDGPMYQYIDIYGNKLFTSDYRYVTSFINGTTVVYDGEGYRVMDTAGQLISERYDHIEQTQNGQYIVTLNEKEGVLGGNGEEIIPVKYFSISYDNNCFIVYEEDYNNACLYDSKGVKLKIEGNFNIIDSKVIKVRSGEDKYYYNIETGKSFSYNKER